MIFDSFRLGMSFSNIAKMLTEKGRKTGKGNLKWDGQCVRRILKNEKYKGDALSQKTYTADPITKKKKKNTGELTMYYVENNHPAIIERSVFDRAQEELARRGSKPKISDKTITQQGRYASKYALSERLFCGECGSPYRHCVWTRKHYKKAVWRCISRLDYGIKYCKHSPTLEEYKLHAAIADAITEYARRGGADIERLKEHIRLYELQSTEQAYLHAKADKRTGNSLQRPAAVECQKQI